MASPLERWVEEVARWTRPERVHWCDGSEEEHERLTGQMLAEGILHRLDPERYPGCTLHRSDPSDVARTEHLTYVCTATREQAGPTNNWMSPAQARTRVGPLLDGSMRGRTLYVIPYILGPASSPYRRLGVELTDSPYVVANMRIMTRMGREALEQIGDTDRFVPGLHSLGDLSPDRRFIVHFPEECRIWSVGSGYGGNALLSKKCFGLRLASWMARQEGWLAEHMLILELEQPSGERSYAAAAFPSACGKTNFAMMVSPLESLGYRVRTIGDDIAWMHVGDDGRLWAINPENGFFGVVPLTSEKTNPNAMRTISRNSIFTNVAMTPDRLPWWEGKEEGPPPAGLMDWRGQPWDGKGPAAHPNSRFTAPIAQCPSLSARSADPDGVPLSALIFGGRRARVPPLVYQARDWAHGVYVGATMASETTAAQSGRTGIVRRDPMAMLPFCGYHMADYFTHWLTMGSRLKRPPAIFHVNWFRTGPDGRYLWPGFGQNLRVLLWILQRAEGQGEAVETPIGLVPRPGSLHLDGLNLSAAALEALLKVDRDEWHREAAEHKAFLDGFGPRLPEALWAQHQELVRRL
ncbi:MAG: phosphoenolpyruvate carboxykinase (GTP) [Planctomycetes bacterium]|nr:phosphoenolpyruvate carboxykinase (GTP) [Planctomycetota bacterium]